MNLYTPAGGLFGTHVTWADVEEDMQNAFDTDAYFGPNKCATNIGEGNGFMSRIVLIDPDWQHKDKELPEKFIVKIVSHLALQTVAAEMAEEKKIENRLNSPEFMATLEKTQKRLHNLEITVYEHLRKLPAGKIPLAKVYYARKFTESNPVKGYIIMEYLDNIKAVHIFENVPLDSIKQILHATAVLEALSLKFTQDEKDCFSEKPFTEIFGEFFRKDVSCSRIS
ncbi:hypothetical protein Y032_0306g1991 [Ancylostoma ceylanicum]|uniref:Protein kinase domain-containing protein n=1 Tax=Ancylostoma ceylanicum TaxID=53326 RepID=A0A016S3E6_9BILA|nr:hypothetical protein Y032_0306g1991 [Ancylostoma ceylanicum]